MSVPRLPDLRTPQVKENATYLENQLGRLRVDVTHLTARMHDYQCHIRLIDLQLRRTEAALADPTISSENAKLLCLQRTALERRRKRLAAQYKKFVHLEIQAKKWLATEIIQSDKLQAKTIP